MSTRRALVICAALFAATLAYTAWMYARLPDIIPIHWDINGKPDGFGSKATAVWLMPGLMVFLVLLMLVLPRISPKRFEPEPLGVYNYLMTLVTGFMGAMQVFTLQASIQPSLRIDGIVMAGIFVLFALIGNVLGKVKRNFWMGVRTPWTLADERVWYATHRSAGRLWVMGGVIGAIAALLGAPAWIMFVLLMVIALVPAVQSYVLYRRLVNGSPQT